MIPNLTHDRLREALDFDPETGNWVRKVKMGHSLPGRFDPRPKPRDGYGRIKVDGYQYLAHRLAWFHIHGEWPKGDIDHINGIRHDNRIANIRDVSRQVNCQNRRSANKNSKYGFLGASPFNGRFMATIGHDGSQEFLGYFGTPEEAHAAYLKAKGEIHVGCTI